MIRPKDGVESEVRSKIIEAAAREFAEQGFQGARVDGIAKRAGINKALLYYHLGDKATLYSEVILTHLKEAQAHMGERLDAAQTPEERLKAVISTVARMAGNYPYLPRLILREAAFGGIHLSEAVLREIGQVFNLIRTVLAEGRTSGSFRETNPLLTHFLIAGSIMFLTVSTPLRQRLREQEGLEIPPAQTPDEIAGLVSDILLNGLLTAKEMGPS